MTMLDMVELKACPFCGAAVSPVREEHPNGDLYVGVICDCGAAMVGEPHWHSSEAEILALHAKKLTAWNRRAALADKPKEGSDDA